jgi:hypothetical protein
MAHMACLHGSHGTHSTHGCKQIKRFLRTNKAETNSDPASGAAALSMGAKNCLSRMLPAAQPIVWSSMFSRQCLRGACHWLHAPCSVQLGTSLDGTLFPAISELSKGKGNSGTSEDQQEKETSRAAAALSLACPPLSRKRVF